MSRPTIVINTQDHNPYRMNERTPLTPETRGPLTKKGQEDAMWTYGRYGILGTHSLLWIATLGISAAVSAQRLAVIITSAVALMLSVMYGITVVWTRRAESAVNRVMVEMGYLVCHIAMLLVIGVCTTTDSLCISTGAALCAASAIPILAFFHLALVTCWLAFVLYLTFTHFVSSSSPRKIPRLHTNVWNLLCAEPGYGKTGQVDGVSVEKWWDQIPTVEERRASMCVEYTGAIEAQREPRLSTSSWHTAEFDHVRRPSGEWRWGDSYVGVDSRRNSYAVEQSGEKGYDRIRSWGAQSYAGTESAYHECQEGDISQGARLLGEKPKGHETRVSIVSTSSSTSEETVRLPNCPSRRSNLQGQG